MSVIIPRPILIVDKLPILQGIETKVKANGLVTSTGSWVGSGVAPAKVTTPRISIVMPSAVPDRTYDTTMRVRALLDIAVTTDGRDVQLVEQLATAIQTALVTEQEQITIAGYQKPEVLFLGVLERDPPADGDRVVRVRVVNLLMYAETT